MVVLRETSRAVPMAIWETWMDYEKDQASETATTSFWGMATRWDEKRTGRCSNYR